MKKTYVACKDGLFYRNPLIIRPGGFFVFPEIEEAERDITQADGLGRVWVLPGSEAETDFMKAILCLLNLTIGEGSWRRLTIVSELLDAEVPDGSVPPRRLPAITFTFRLLGKIPKPEQSDDVVRYESRLRNETVLGCAAGVGR